MKALTVWQPWATLIAIGAKPYEFRGWVPPKNLRGRRIAIHAGARPVRKREVIDLIERLGDRHAPPCLHARLALPLLDRVLRGLDKRPGGPSFFEDDEPFRLPLSSIVCTAILGEPKRGEECAAEFGWRQEAVTGGEAEQGPEGFNDSDRTGTFNWGWPMLDVEPLLPPVEARGAQGFWDWQP